MNITTIIIFITLRITIIIEKSLWWLLKIQIKAGKDQIICTSFVKYTYIRAYIPIIQSIDHKNVINGIKIDIFISLSI